jgi:outer membrane protein OmpA-like peptidoglycan-associated protein
MTTDNRYFLEEVAGYMRRYTQRDLRITGYYTQEEPQGRYGRYDNLGQARAATVARWLEQQGVSESRILLDYVRVEADSLSEPITFHIITDID